MSATDPIIDAIGNIGKWQWLIITALASRDIFTSWQMLSQSFLGMAPQDYFCDESGYQNFTSLQEWQNFANPVKEDGSIDKCVVYDLEYENLNLENLIGTNGSQLTSVTRKCENWVFHSNESSTLITDFQILCDKSWYMTLAQVVYMFGVMCGLLVSGIVSDLFGRRLSLLMFMVLLCISSFAAAFSPNIWAFVVARWFIAAATMSVATISYIYGMEIIGGDWKTYLGIGMMFNWATGYCLLPLVAYLIPNWTDLQLALTAPLPIFVVIFWFIPECPRWLVTKGKFDEANKIIKQACKMNGLTWNGELKNTAIQSDENVAQKSILDLFKTPNLRAITLIEWFNWFTVVMVYYGLTLNADALIPGNVYLNYSVGGLIEFPTYVMCIIVLHYFGRRIPLAAMFIFSGTVLFLSLAFSDPQVLLAVMSIGKIGNVGVFAIIYLQTAELFPTIVRTTAFGSCSIISRIGSMLAPVIARELDPALVITIFATLSLVAGIFTSFLPETKGKKLPDTMEEGEDLGLGHFSCTFTKRQDYSLELREH